MSMVKLFTDLKCFLKSDTVTIDTVLFRANTIFTTLLLCSACVMITAQQFVGKPIECLVESLPSKPVNSYCWAMGKFTVSNAFAGKIGSQVAHPGISNHMSEIQSNIELAKEHELDGKKLITKKEFYQNLNDKFVSNVTFTQPPISYHNYYQWVCFVLFFQAMACYVPKMIWEAYEGKLMQALVSGRNGKLFSQHERNKIKNILLRYMVSRINRHRIYALRYWMCEGLCLANALCQLFLMDWFFQGNFLTYGLDVIGLTRGPTVYSMDRIFPKVAKCTFRKYGAGGSIQTHDALCVLALNNINEKTYILIWYWFAGLSILNCISFANRLATVCFQSLRARLINSRGKLNVTRKDAKSLLARIDFGDWWLLSMLGENLDADVYRELILGYSKSLDKLSSSNTLFSTTTI